MNAVSPGYFGFLSPPRVSFPGLGRSDRRRRQTPERPPRFSSRRTAPISTPALDPLDHVVDRQAPPPRRPPSPPSPRRCGRRRAPRRGCARPGSRAVGRQLHVACPPPAPGDTAGSSRPCASARRCPASRAVENTSPFLPVPSTTSFRVVGRHPHRRLGHRHPVRSRACPPRPPSAPAPRSSRWVRRAWPTRSLAGRH